MRGYIVIVAVGCLALLAWFLTAFSNTEATAPPQSGSDAVAKSPTSTASIGTADATSSKTDAPTTNLEVDREQAHVVSKDVKANVQVIAYETKEPIANAEVRYLPPDFDWQTMTPEWQALANKDYEALVRVAGLLVRTDSNGFCHVELGERGVSLIARSDDLFAQSYVAADHKDVIVVELQVDRTLNVRVLDANGQPATGVMVIVIVANPDRSANLNRWQIGSTDSEGRCTRAHCQALSEAAKSASLQVACIVTGQLSKAVNADLRVPPDEVVLRLPPTGMVRVRITDAHGRSLDTRYLGDGNVRLATFEEDPNGDRESDGYNQNGASAPIDGDGIATFSHVSLGKFVVMRSGHFGTTARGDGPTATRHEVDFEIKEGAKDSIFTGILVAADATPFPNQKFLATYRSRRGMGSRQAATDDTGKFRVNLGSSLADKKCQLTFQLQGTHGEAQPSAEFADQTIRAGANDLGRVVLTAPRVLLAGRVVCDPSIKQREPRVAIERRNGERWTQLHNLRLKWQKDGSFTLNGGMPEGARLKLKVTKGAYLPVAPIECQVGDLDIEIPLRAAGLATATFLVDEHVPLQRLLCKFLPMEPPAKKDRLSAMREGFRSHFHGPSTDGQASKTWSGLARGRYVLTVVCQGSEQEVLRIEAVEITSGLCSDPRLTDIDLRGRIRELEIVATGLDGSAIQDREAFVVVRNEGTEWRGYNLASGKVRIASVTAADIFVVAKGYEMATRTAITKSQSIPMQPCRSTSVKVELPRSLPEGTRLSLQLHPKLGHNRRGRITLDTGRGMGLSNFFVEELPVPADGIVNVPVRWPGDYTVLAKLSPSGRGGWALRKLTPKVLALPTTGTVIQIDGTALDKLLERMSK